MMMTKRRITITNAKSNSRITMKTIAIWLFHSYCSMFILAKIITATTTTKTVATNHNDSSKSDHLYPESIHLNDGSTIIPFTTVTKVDQSPPKSSSLLMAVSEPAESSTDSIENHSTTSTKMIAKAITRLTDREEQSLALEMARKRCEHDDDQNKTRDASRKKYHRKYCPKVWDGALCWPESPPNRLHHLPCPEYVKGFNHNGKAYKNCTKNGHWYFNNETQRYWTDYSECTTFIMGSLEDDTVSWKLSKIRNHLKNFQIISHLGYSISFISLVVAFFILIYVKIICRRLRCPRNSLHLQLFISFIIRSSMFLIKASLEQSPFDPNHLLSDTDGIGGDDDSTNHMADDQTTSTSVSDLSLVDNGGHATGTTANDWINSLLTSSITCKLFTTIWQYSLLANYNWIFMEGLYLHNVIFLNIFNDHSNIIPYIILGWCLPIPIVSLWALMRSLYEDTSCWQTNSNLTIFWIMRAPITIIIVLNFAFFVNIIRVLFLKMFAKSAANYARKYKYRTWFRSTLVLVPLFGVHYMVFLAFTTFTFNSYDIFEIIWLYTDLTFTTFQGCLVAMLYCFFNHEVQIELKKLWLSLKHNLSRRYSHNHPSNSTTNGQNHHATTCNSRNNTRHSLMSNCSSFFKKELENNTSSDFNHSGMVNNNHHETMIKSNPNVEKTFVQINQLANRNPMEPMMISNDDERDFLNRFILGETIL